MKKLTDDFLDSKRMKFTALLFITLLMACKVSQAQVKMRSGQYSSGYVVTIEKDTLEGVIELFDEISSCREVYFKKSKVDSQPTIYNPEDLIAYSRRDETYVAYDDVYCLLKPCINENFNRVFIKLIEQDVLNVFMYAANRHTSHDYAIKYIPVVQKKGFEPIPYKNKKHIKKVVSSYFEDFPALAAKIRDYKYKNEDFDIMVEEYTKWYKAN